MATLRKGAGSRPAAHPGQPGTLLDSESPYGSRRVVVEYDGREARLERARFTHDRRRGNAFANLAVEVRRFSADDYYKTSARQRLRELERALELARERRPRYAFGLDTLPAPRSSPLPTLASTLAA